jgi:CheY-like chemotaxis protein
MNILLIDDSSDNFLIWDRHTSKLCVQTTFCESAQATIERFKVGEEFDIIFIDHYLPEMKGPELKGRIEQILQESKKKSPVFVAVSARGEPDFIQENIENGYSHFLQKPFNKKQLIALLSEYIEIEKSETRFDRNRADILEYRPRYLKNRLEDFDKAKKAFEQRNYQELGSICHRILGTAASYGFLDLEKIIKALQNSVFQKNEKQVIKDLMSWEDYHKITSL